MLSGTPMKIFSPKFYNFAFRSCALIFAAVFVSKFARDCTDTFTIPAIRSNRPFNPQNEARPLTREEQEEVRSALSQSYHYFGCGGQAYAFFSEDGKYVVKFFKQRLFKPNWLLNHFPLPSFLHRYRAKKNFARLDKLRRDFFSYRISFDTLQSITGVIYCHLNPTDTLHTKLEIIDSLHIHHNLNLDDYDFVVQKRAERVYDQIDKWISEGNLEAAKQGIGSVFTLISNRALQGYRDRDPNIRTNCGFIENRAVKIDVGRFVKEESMKTPKRHNEDLIRITAPFEQWVRDNHPQLIDSFENQMQEKLL